MKKKPTSHETKTKPRAFASGIAVHCLHDELVSPESLEPFPGGNYRKHPAGQLDKFERIVAKNDFDMAAQNAHRHRACFKNTRYTFCQKETFVGRGGQAAHRNSDTEKADVARLRKKWGPIFKTGGHSGTRKRDYAGAVKITMNLPF